MKKRPLRHSLRTLCLVIGVAGAAPTLAEDIYKCTDVDGKVQYQKGPCAGARQAEKKEIDPNRNVVPMEGPPPSYSSQQANPSADGSTPGSPTPDAQKTPPENNSDGSTTIIRKRRY